MLFERNAFGGVSYTAQVGPNTSFSLQWVDLGGLIPAFPSAAADGAGRTVVAAVGTDARLYVRRQSTPSPIADFEPWVAVGLPFPVPDGLQRPGDSNQDGNLDLSDAVWILGHLFGGNTASLPGEGGTASSPGPGGLSVVDVNGDGGIDISDAVFILGVLVLGDRPPPALGRECVGV